MTGADGAVCLCALRIAVGGFKIQDPIHRVRTAVAAPAVRIQRNLLETAHAPPHLENRFASFPAAEQVAEHKCEQEQRLGQAQSEIRVSASRVFCWSKAILSRIHDFRYPPATIGLHIPGLPPLQATEL